MGQPWGAVLELHAWWHLLTAVSAYTFMALIEFLTAPEHLDGSYGEGFAWPATEVLKDIVPDMVNGESWKGKMDSVANGVGKKRR